MKKIIINLLTILIAAQMYGQCAKSGVTTYSFNQAVASRNFPGDVVITGGAIVTFNGNFTFRKDAFIRVEKGSRLIIHNSTLSAFCTDIQQEWWGIQVLGINQNFVLGFFLKPSHLEVQNSTIKNSVYGLVNSDNPNFNLNNMNNCGSMHLDGVTFLDNLGDLKLIKPYIHSSNLSLFFPSTTNLFVMDFFRRCKFIRNGYYYNNSAKYFIDVYEGSFGIRQSSFESSGGPIRKPFINAVDVFASIDACTFKGGDVGVRTSRISKTMTTNVRDNKFENVFTAVDVKATNFATVRYNQTLNNQSFNAIVHHSGTDFNYMHNSLESNGTNLGQFFNSGNGIWLNNVGKANHSIAFNSFKNVTNSIISNGVHHNGNNSGLVIRCNKISLSTATPPNYNPSMPLGREIVIERTPPGQPLYGIKTVQASIHPTLGRIENAGNTFTNHSVIFPNYFNGQSSNPTNGIQYYYTGGGTSSNPTFPFRISGNINRISTSDHKCSEFYILKSASGFLDPVEKIAIKTDFDVRRIDYLSDKATIQSHYAQNSVTPQTIELEKIVSLKKENLDDLNRHLVVDALMLREFTPDGITDQEVVETIRQSENENAEYLVADFYFQYEKYNEAIETLQNIESKFELNDNDRLNIRDLISFYTILQQARVDNRDIFHLTETEYNGMRAIASSEIMTVAKVRACNLLTSALDENCSYPTALSNDENIDKNTGQSLKAEVIIYPNPTENILNIQLKNMQASYLNIVDIQGRVVYSESIPDGKNEWKLPLRKYITANGSYRLNLWKGDQMIESQMILVE